MSVLTPISSFNSLYVHSLTAQCNLTSDTYSSIHTQERQSPHLLIEDDDDVILQVDDVMGHVAEAAIVLPSSSSRRLADLPQVRSPRYLE
jgi:hypothetical protein